MFVLESFQVFSPTTVGQRTACREVGTKHHLVWREQFARLGHEMHTAHHHHPCVGLSRLTGQRQRVAHEVGYLLDVTHSVVVSQDNRIFLPTQLSDLGLQIQSLVNGFVDKSLFHPFCFHHLFIIIFSFTLIFKKIWEV